MEIRKYQEKDFEATKYVCINDMIGRTSDDLIEYVETMFCKYYLEKEPECCFVAVDENDKPIGYVYGVKDYNKYQSDFGEYLKQIEKINNRKYLTAALTEMYDHAVYQDTYPAHLHIDVLPGYQSKGIGSRLITAFCDYLKSENVRGVMLIVDTENLDARRFYERNGFILLHDVPTGAAYGKKLI